MIYLSYVREPTRFTDMYAWMDKWCHKYEVFPVIIRPEHNNQRYPPWYFDSYDSARTSNELKDFTWVYLDIDADIMLDDYQHPKDNVVYALGSDYHGFGAHKMDGVRVRVDGGIQYAAVVAPLVLYDRELYLKGKRT